jgi:hypothetical protein
MVRDLKGVMEREAATKVRCHDARRWAALMFLSRKDAKARRKVAKAHSSQRHAGAAGVQSTTCFSIHRATQTEVFG